MKKPNKVAELPPVPERDAKGEPVLKVKVTMEFPIERIANMLCTALEGGSNYWYLIRKHIKPPTYVYKTMATSTPAGKKVEIIPHIDDPCNEGGALMIGDLEEEKRKPIRLDLPAMQRGLQLMSEKYQHHFADFLAENDDAITGDVFLQLCLFGEVIYG